MNDAEWQDFAKEVIQAVGSSGLHGHRGMASGLVQLADLLDRAPSGFKARHANVPEPEFTREQTAAEKRLLEDDPSIAFATDPAQLLLRIGAQIAALDAIHHQLVGVDAPADPNKDWRVAIQSGNMYLIPRRKLYRSSSRRSSMRHLSRRDLMPFHRILPTKLGGFDVRLTWRDLAAAWALDLKLGGVLFPELKFDEANSANGFLVTGVICSDQDAQVGSHLEAGHKAQCAAVVFPELTIEPAVRTRLKKRLQERMLWAEERPRSCPSLVVAGSWHEAVGGHEHVNVATVFDAYGELVLRHEKMLTFWDRDSRPERIRPGTTINVLVTEEALIAFGICLDFCERAHHGPFPDLDVDYVLVPSCGNAKTMEGHIATARDMRTRFRCRAFVVQQPNTQLAEIDGRKPLGFILGPTSRLDIATKDTLIYKAWSIQTAD
jgi:hypothetical protein